MSGTDLDRAKLRKRLNRILGQVEALQRALVKDAGTTKMLQQATACRGALDSFIAEVIEDHIRSSMPMTRFRRSSRLRN
jgi:DNA-binding FrmR family transcriptional regulator